MKRVILATTVFVAAAVGAVWAYQAAARDHDYRALLARGDAALRDDQTFVAIEAYSGAVALPPDSMLAHPRPPPPRTRRAPRRPAVRGHRSLQRSRGPAARLDARPPAPRRNLSAGRQ